MLCGTCTVLVDGSRVNIWFYLTLLAEGHSITTIESLEKDGRMSEIQEAFIRHGAVQCGFCSPGMVISVECQLSRNGDSFEKEIRRGVSGNLCRCTGFRQMVDAITEVAAARRAK